jgi:hypothetical protein
MAPRSRLFAACAALVIWSIPAVVSACAARPMEQDATSLVVAAASEPLALQAGATDVALRVVGDERTGLPRQTLSARLRGEVAGRQIYLTFTGVTVQTPPGVVYNVYLNRPAGESDSGPASPHYLGALSFFNASREPCRELALNVTAPLDRLLARGELDAHLQLSIVPAVNPDPAAAPRIQSIRLIVR